MRTKRVLKLVCVILAFVFLMSMFAACKKDDSKSDTTTTKKSTTTAQKATTAKSAEEAKVKWSGTISVASYHFAPTDPAKDFVRPAIEEGLKKHGYDVTIEDVYIEYPQYADIIGVRIAGGTAPDIWISLSSTQINTWYEQGAIKAWDKDFFFEHAPDLAEYFNNGEYDGRLIDHVDLFWELSMKDGKMVTIPKFREQNAMLMKVLAYRTDWLDNLGYKYDNPTDLPMKIDDFMDLMYKFAHNDPDKNNQKDTFGFNNSVIKVIFGAYGNQCGFPGSAPQWYVRDGKMVNSDLLPENKEVLALLQKAYADEVLDPEFITGENTGGYWAISHSFINGIIGATAHASVDHWRRPDVLGDEGNTCYKEFIAVNGTDCYVFGPWPAGPNGDYGLSIGVPANHGENAVYNAAMDDDKMAAILGVMNAFFIDDELSFLAHFGKEGVTFDYNDKGNPVMKLSNEELNQHGVWAYRSLYGADSPYNKHVTKINFYEAPVWKNILGFQANPQCDSKYVTQLYVTLPSDTLYKGDLRTYRDETWINIITGKESVDYWDKFVEEYRKRGGDVLEKEANDWYQSK